MAVRKSVRELAEERRVSPSRQPDRVSDYEWGQPLTRKRKSRDDNETGREEEGDAQDDASDPDAPDAGSVEGEASQETDSDPMAEDDSSDSAEGSEPVPGDAQDAATVEGTEVPMVGTAAIRTVKEVRKLATPIDDTRLMEMGRRQSMLRQESARTEDERKSQSDELKAKIKDIEAEMDRLADNISAGKEFVQVECEVTYDYPAGKVRVVRTDTGEKIEERDMKYEEKQMRVPGA